MPRDPKKRQKQQERRAAKRKAKQHQLAREQHAGLPERLARAAGYPLLHCWATEDLWTQGLGWVCLSRSLPNGFVAFTVFLVDRYCLGVKNVLLNILPGSEYDRQIARKMRASFVTKPMQPAAARKFIEGAVEYARGLGFAPHPDYAKAQLLFGDIDAGASQEEFEYGKDCQPFFIAGPNDSLERCRRILQTLERTCGPGRFHYTVPISGDADVLPESLRQAEPRVIGPDESGTIREYTLEAYEDRAAQGELP